MIPVVISFNVKGGATICARRHDRNGMIVVIMESVRSNRTKNPENKRKSRRYVCMYAVVAAAAVDVIIVIVLLLGGSSRRVCVVVCVLSVVQSVDRNRSKIPSVGVCVGVGKANKKKEKKRNETTKRKN